MTYGANEATMLTTSPLNVEGTNLHFGVGQWAEGVLEKIVAKDPTDSKMRLVYDIDGTQSGAVFAGNKLVSSKILDITTNEVTKNVFDPESGAFVETIVETPADKVTVKWFGTKVDPADNVEKTQIWETSFDIINAESVKALIAEVEERLQDQIDVIDASIDLLDSSVTEIKDFLKDTELVTSDPSTGAITVEVEGEEDEFKTYKVTVNTDGKTVKVNDKNQLATATYSIEKLTNESEGYDANFASQYQLMMTDVDGSVTPVGEKINIMKDFLLKGAHVCTFEYVKVTDETTAEETYQLVEYAPEDDTHMDAYHKGDDVTEYKPIYALVGGSIADGTAKFEKAPVGKGIKIGNSYLHMILNTKDDDEVLVDENGNPKEGQEIFEDETTKYQNDLLTDVYLDFSEFFQTFKGDNKYISISPEGVVSLDADAVTEYINASLGITDKFDELDATDASIIERLDDLEGQDASILERLDVIDSSIAELEAVDASILERLDILDSSVCDIEASYLVDVSLVAPKPENEQFNQVTIVKKENGVETEVSVDIANDKYYSALNDAIDTLAGNDEYIVGLLTWENLD